MISENLILKSMFNLWPVETVRLGKDSHKKCHESVIGGSQYYSAVD